MSNKGRYIMSPARKARIISAQEEAREFHNLWNCALREHGELSASIYQNFSMNAAQDAMRELTMVIVQHKVPHSYWEVVDFGSRD